MSFLGFAQGGTRWVFLIGRWAFKVPRMSTWESFLWGLLGNIQEREWGALGRPEVCPVVAALPLGFCVVMQRVSVCTDADFPSNDHYRRLTHPEHGRYVVPAEWKPDSFGYLQGRLVAVDYGSPTQWLLIVSVKELEAS